MWNRSLKKHKGNSTWCFFSLSLTQNRALPCLSSQTKVQLCMRFSLLNFISWPTLRLFSKRWSNVASSQKRKGEHGTNFQSDWTKALSSLFRQTQDKSAHICYLININNSVLCRSAAYSLWLAFLWSQWPQWFGVKSVLYIPRCLVKNSLRSCKALSSSVLVVSNAAIITARAR